MNDKRGEEHLRAAVHKHLLAHAWRAPDTLVVNELGVLHGRARIDIAVINGHLRGIELKSREDTLERLPVQVQSYGSVVDYATLVVDERLASHAETILPGWWGLIKVIRTETCTRFLRLRPERANPHPDPIHVARLLWQTEAASLLERFTGRSDWRRKRREELYQALAEGMSLPRLKREVRSTLKSRLNWRGRVPPASDGGLFPPSAMWKDYP